MNYCFDAEKISLDELRNRIETSDLVPSRASLLDGLDEKLKKLEKAGMTTLAALRKELKDNKRLFAIADQMGIDKDYLALLRREAESYFPKPFALKEFISIPAEIIDRLESMGIRNTADLFEKADMTKASSLDAALLDNFIHCVDLTRIQWINPTAARMMVDAGYDTPAKVEPADPEVLCEALMTINKDNSYFKGNIGLRDIKRLVHAAKYVSLWYAA